MSVYTKICLIDAMKFGTDKAGPMRMNPSDLSDALTFHVVPSSGHNFNDLLQILAKQIAFPSPCTLSLLLIIK